VGIEEICGESDLPELPEPQVAHPLTSVPRKGAVLDVDFAF
jgi:hypothetical protein